jgi:hypothetical protein
MRTNLAERPALKNGSTEWFGPGGWARTTSAHASLPRTTAWAGTTPGNIQPNRGTAVAGRWYVWSASVRFVAPSTISTGTDWYASGNVYDSSTDGQDYNQAGSTTIRVVSGVGQAPPLAVSIRPTINNIDGETQVTAVLIEEYLSEAAATAALAAHATAAYYFDGDGDGIGNVGAAYDWTGTDGESPSTSTAGNPATAAIDFAPMAMAALGKRRKYGTAALVFQNLQLVTGLIATAQYDEQRGRVRVDASNMAPAAIRAVVESRVLGTTRWRVVRGGKVAASAGRFLRPVDDYEYVSGADTQYRITALSSAENQPDAVVHSKILTVTDIPQVSWVKFIAAPYLNKRVDLSGWGPVTRKSKNATFSVRGRPDPIGVTDVHDARQVTVRFITHTIAARDALDSALAAGAPLFFQTPTSVACPSIYATAGDYGWESLTRRSERAEFTVPLTEVGAPPPSIVGSGLTWATVTASYGSWAELPDTFGSWRELMS